jgi:hypothetical protein
VKRRGQLKIASQKNNDVECRPHDEKIEITKEKQTAFYSALVEAWLETKMEKDKSLLMLSAGGVGVLVTLFNHNRHTFSASWLPFCFSADFFSSVDLPSDFNIRQQRGLHSLLDKRQACK